MAAATDRLEMSRRLGLAQRIVTELRGALDHAVGGEIAANLASLYDYVFHEILQMQLNQEPDHAENCQRVLAAPAGRLEPDPGRHRRPRTRTTEASLARNLQPDSNGPCPPPRVTGGQHLVSISA